MKIDIDYEAASELSGRVMMQEYESLLENGCFYSGTDESYMALLEAYRTVIEYSTTEQERKAHGLLGAETMTGENETQ